MNNAYFAGTEELSDTISDRNGEFLEDVRNIGDDSVMPSSELTIDKYVVVCRVICN